MGGIADDELIPTRPQCASTDAQVTLGAAGDKERRFLARDGCGSQGFEPVRESRVFAEDVVTQRRQTPSLRAWPAGRVNVSGGEIDAGRNKSCHGPVTQYSDDYP